MRHRRAFRRLRVAPAVAAAVLATAVLPGSPAAQACAGCTPLDDAGGPAYLGVYPLGLYPGASNSPPASHLSLALAAAAAVIPRDASGQPDPNGRIGFISIGMSNTNQEFAAFERAADQNVARNARVVIVDCAVGGQSADVIVNPAAGYWSVVDGRVAAAGLDPDQVQVAWLKQADGMVPTFSFPAHAETLATHLRGIVAHLKDRFPALQLCLVSSRIYGGYTTNPARGEPLSYETAFAFRSLIAAQIAGDPSLNADPGAGPVEAPVLWWGPYLWANGAVPRASDGLTWQPSDLEGDGVHPSASGEAKVAALLAGFLAADAASTPWYLAHTGADLVSIGASKDAFVDDNQPAQNFGASPELTWAHASKRCYVQFDLPAVVDSVVYAKLSLKTPPNVAMRSAEVVVVSDTGWDEATVAAANAPVFDGAVLGTIPVASRGTAVSLDVTDAVQAALALAPGAAQLSLGVRALPGPSSDQQVGSRESSDGPRLVLTTVPRAASVGRAPPLRALEILTAPNPARRQVRVVLRGLRAGERVAVSIVDVRGMRVRALFDGVADGPAVERVWDSRDDRGGDVPSGVYFVHARARRGDGLDTGAGARKIVVVR
jgi:hypothetical protein